jgi:recombination protein RecA
MAATARSRRTATPTDPAKKTPANARQRAKLIAASTVRDKRYGPDSLLLASKVIPPPPRISTGSLSFDAALGGGFPANQWTEIVGNESSGKTSLVLKTIAHQQSVQKGYTVFWASSEPWDPSLAAMCGVDSEGVYLLEENVMELVFEKVLEFVEARAADMIVIDSYPALVTALEDKKDVGETTMGGAKILNLFMRKGTKASKRSLLDSDDLPFCGIIINQWREKIGVMHGDPRTTPGGKGKNFWMYCRIDVRRDEWIVNSRKEKVGQVIKIVVMKMKGARPQQVGVTDFYFADDEQMKAGEYDYFKALLYLADLYELIPRKGTGYVGPSHEFYKSEALLLQAIYSQPDWKRDIEVAVLRLAQTGHAPLATEEEAITGLDDDDDEAAPVPVPTKTRSRRQSIS